jgi:hypothetical protein
VCAASWLCVCDKGDRAGMPGLRLSANNDSGTRTVDYGSAGASPSQRNFPGTTEHQLGDTHPNAFREGELPWDHRAPARRHPSKRTSGGRTSLGPPSTSSGTPIQTHFGRAKILLSRYNQQHSKNTARQEPRPPNGNFTDN